MTNKLHKATAVAVLLCAALLLCACVAQPGAATVAPAASSAAAGDLPAAPADSAPQTTAQPELSPAGTGGPVPDAPPVIGDYAAHPFAPWVPAPVPAGPYQPLPVEGFSGTIWHHFLNPDYADLPNPTYQLRFENGNLMLSLASYGTDNGAAFFGPFAAFEGGVVATVQALALGEDPSGPAIPVSVAASFDGENVKTVLLTLGWTGPVPKNFEWAFGAIKGQTLVFTLYTGFLFAEGA